MYKKTLLMRSVLVFIYIFLLAFTFITGRTHTLLVDNKDTLDGLKAEKLVEISINKEDSVEFFKGDRDKFFIKGQRVKLIIEFSDGREPVTCVTRIPIKEDIMILSIPKLLAGESNFIEPFVN